MLLFDHPSSKCWPHTGQTVGCPCKKYSEIGRSWMLAWWRPRPSDKLTEHDRAVLVFRNLSDVSVSPGKASAWASNGMSTMYIGQNCLHVCNTWSPINFPINMLKPHLSARAGLCRTLMSRCTFRDLRVLLALYSRKMNNNQTPD